MSEPTSPKRKYTWKITPEAKAQLCKNRVANMLRGKALVRSQTAVDVNSASTVEQKEPTNG